MNRISLFILSLLATIALSDCSSPTGLTVKGSVENAENLSAYFDMKDLNNTIQNLGKAELDTKGNFSFNFPDGVQAGVYRVRIGASAIDLILDGTESLVEINADIEKIRQLEYTVTGSPASETYRASLKDYAEGRLAKDKLVQTIQSTDNAILSLALSLGFSPASADNYLLYKSVADKLGVAYPESSLTKQYNEFASTMERQYTFQQSRYKVRLGEKAPDIVMADVRGKERKLSDLQGKIVLLDFWASWCGPCRRANPHVVETYHKYKDQGFTVFSVSLDGLDSRTRKRYSDQTQIDTQLKNSKNRWIQAIEKDKLVWDDHVSDLKKWESQAAALYGVRSIPTTFLINRDGTIAALNPRNNLEEEIKKLL